MLEIRHLSKVYRTRGGADVHALDDVSLRFEETGMVFLLGKSGSGKSTLLNLCGGLDTPDEGEIIIKGRSSKDFTQADFDSYRNTFVGFVFQEYNILDEFSVEENIALALELQGKGRDKARVREILEQVELAEFARRKPNTLSGGQKQRVAIARALVKNPEIIMADEPTGALDSNTGKQVFDTLKKLSESKLVLVVSHDREFAEIYGDRIVELKDGKVISDVVKTKLAPHKASENVTVLAGNILSVKNGAALSDDDMAQIRAFLAANREETLIAGGAKEVRGLKKTACIDENGVREAFAAAKTPQPQQPYVAEDTQFIRSCLPMRHAVRIGASSMRNKPFRLAFTIFLSFLAFTLFGLFSTLAFYDQKEVTYNTYLDAGYERVNIMKFYNSSREFYYERNDEYLTESKCPYVLFSPKDLTAFRAENDGALGVFDYQNRGLGRWSDGTVTGVYNADASDGSVSFLPMYSFGITDLPLQAEDYYYTEIQAFGAVDPDSQYWQSRLLTRTDLSALGDDGIVISSYLFDSLKASGIRAANGAPLQFVTDIVGVTLRVLSPQEDKYADLVVCGVYDYSPPQEWYDELFDSSSAENDYSARLSVFENNLFNGFYCLALVSDSFYEANYRWYNIAEDPYEYGMEQWDHFEKVSISASYGAEGPASDLEEAGPLASEISYTGPYSDLMPDKAKDIYFFGEAPSALADGQIIVSFSCYFSQWMHNDYRARGIAFDSEEYKTCTKISDILSTGEYTADSHMTVDGYNRFSATRADIEWALGQFLALVEARAEDPAAALPTQAEINGKTYTVVGFWYGPSTPGTSDTAVYFSQNDFMALRPLAKPQMTGNDEYIYYSFETKYVPDDDACYTSILLPVAEPSALRAAVNGDSVISEVDDSYYKMVSPITQQLDDVDSTLSKLELIFLFVGLGMAVFAMLLLFNFISASITNKKKEIGILRAVGARSSDVFKIFFSESAIIACICFVLSMAASFGLCYVLNNIYAASIGASIFVFGPLSWLVMLGITFVTSFAATYFPVYSIARKKPVESIRAL